MRSRERAEKAASVMARAVNSVAADVGKEDVGPETDFSGQMIGQMKARIPRLSDPLMTWETAVSEASGPPSEGRARLRARQLLPGEESQFGADIVVVLDINTRDYATNKGLLIQVKRVGPRCGLRSTRPGKLQKQCLDMLQITASAFVVLYRANDVLVLGASAVGAAGARRMGSLSYSCPYWFFFDFLSCWIGDPRIKATDQPSLATLRDQTNARLALLIKATERFA